MPGAFDLRAQAPAFTPLGGFVPLWGASDNPTINGVEYLRTGVLKAIAGYASFAASNPQATWQLIVPKSAITVFSNIAGIRFASSRYYTAMGGGQSPQTGATLSSAWGSSTGTSNNTINDMVVINGRVCLANQGNNIDTFNGGTAATNNPTTLSMTAGAVNAAGTLATFIRSSTGANGAFTTTDGITFTTRTTTAAGSANAILATWQPVSSTFVMLGADARPYTCTDGFTFTQRAVISGVTPSPTSISSPVGSIASDYAAATSAVTCFSAIVNNGTYQSGQAHLIRSTDGINFSATPWASLISGVAATTLPRIFAVDSTLYAHASQSMGSDRNVWHSSSDGGLSWTPLALFAPTQQWSNNVYAVGLISYINGEFVALPSGAGAPSEGVLSTSTLGATHIGSYLPAQASATGSGQGTIPFYQRIK